MITPIQTIVILELPCRFIVLFSKQGFVLPPSTHAKIPNGPPAGSKIKGAWLLPTRFRRVKIAFKPMLNQDH